MIALARGVTHGRNGPVPVDLTGQRFGMLTVIGLQGMRPKPGRRFGVIMWACVCECGGHRNARADALKGGHTQSCGCQQRANGAKQLAAYRATSPRLGRHRHTVNGASRTYNSWSAMRSRCHNPKCTKYPTYGARGIVVCDRWRQSFDAFLADMGERPAGRTLDRKDPSGNYELDNCRWATPYEQWLNRRCMAGLV